MSQATNKTNNNDIPRTPSAGTLKEEYMGNVGSNRSYDNYLDQPVRKTRGPNDGTGSSSSSLLWMIIFLLVTFLAITFTDNPWSPIQEHDTKKDAATAFATGDRLSITAIEGLLQSHLYASISAGNSQSAATALHNALSQAGAGFQEIGSRIVVLSVPDAVHAKMNTFADEFAHKAGISAFSFLDDDKSKKWAANNKDQVGIAFVHQLESLPLEKVKTLAKSICGNQKEESNSKLMYVLTVSDSLTPHKDKADALLAKLAEKWGQKVSDFQCLEKGQFASISLGSKTLKSFGYLQGKNKKQKKSICCYCVCIFES